MRRTLSFVAIVGVAGGLVFGIVPTASADVVNGSSGAYTFSADNTDVRAGAAVTGYSGSGAAVIPASVTIAGVRYAVTSIAEFAFVGCTMTSVVIPNSVTSIGQESFGYCLSLASVTMGDSVTSIDLFAFVNDVLTTVVFPDSMTDIGYYAFYGNQLASITIPASVTTIGDGAFQFNDLSSVTIPASVTSLGARAFTLDPGLTTVVFDGAAPADTSSVDSGQQSFDTDGGLTVYYQWAFGSPQTDFGFTSPTWLGYATQAITTATFDLNGHGGPVAAQSFNSGGLVTEPVAPTASGWKFTGWFTAPDLTTSVDFADPLVTDETLEAGWTADPALAVTGIPNALSAVPGGIAALVLGALLILVALRRRNRDSA